MNDVLEKLASRVARPEDGIALPVTLSVLLIAALLGAATMIASTKSVSQSTRDRSVKRSVEAADAGIEIASNRLTIFANILTDDKPCVVTGSGTLTTEPVQDDGWCPAQTETHEDGASSTYRVSDRQLVTVGGQDNWQRKIVSTGTVGGVDRRVVALVNSPIADAALFPVSGVFSDAKLEMDSNSRIDGDAGSNGDIETKSNARICGDAHPGPGESFNGPDNCPGHSRAPASAEISLPQVTIPQAHDNSTLTGVSGWNAANRTLVVDGTVTLTGDTYVLCYLEFTSNGGLNVGTRTAAAPLRIFLDSPANCSTSNEGSVRFESNTTINNPNSDPTTFQLYLKGTPLGTAPRNQSPLTVDNNPFDTRVTLESNVLSTGMVIYAPNSEVMLSSNTEITGAIAAGRVRMDSNSRIYGDDRALNVTGFRTAGSTQRMSWVECRPAMATDPSPETGC